MKLATYVNNPADRALWQKAVEGFRYISGSGWEERADYRHFWPMISHLYLLAYGPTKSLPNSLKLPLAFMLGGHSGRVRKGIRQRPYFHHIVMVLYLTWLLDLPLDVQLAAIAHDDVEDLPKALGVTADWVKGVHAKLIGATAAGMVILLTNAPHPQGKHAGQLQKMADMPAAVGELKILDRVCNLYDMRQDKPKHVTPAHVRQQCTYALELLHAIPQPGARGTVRVMLAFMVSLLAQENNLLLVGVD